MALALAQAGASPQIVKLVQTGAEPGDEGDAHRAGRLAGVPHRELARYARPADPWSAALAAGQEPPAARELAEALTAIPGALVAEGAGGIMAPLNADEHLGHVARLAKLEAIVVVGLRLGCLNHALLTARLAHELELPVAGAVLVERWEAASGDYLADVARVLGPRLPLLGILPFGGDEGESVRAGAKLFESLVKQER